MKHSISSILPALPLLLASCSFGEQWDVDFDNLPQGSDKWFQVTAQRTTDLAAGIPSDCYLMGEPVINIMNDERFRFSAEEMASSTPEGMQRSSSTTAANVVQSLFNYAQRNKVIELAGTYESIDLDFNPIRLSGKVVIPADGKAKGMILVSHYTIGSNAEAPSNCFPLEAVLAHLGYVMIFPDYLGYGVTADQLHPYLVLEQTMINEADMLEAVVPFLKAAGVQLEDERQLMLMGYSQGGANTMSLLYFLETMYPDKYDIHRVFAGGGPYDVLATYDRFVVTDTAGYPVAVPLVMQGMIRGNRLNINMEDLVQPFIAENLDKWVNSKRYTTAQVNGFINSHVTHEILSEMGMARESVEVSELYKAMTENSILSYSWTPEAPIYMFHSMDDEVVTFTNATHARAKWSNGNIQYNFGHYGTHIKGCLRFIFSVRTLLEEENR